MDEETDLLHTTKDSSILYYLQNHVWCEVECSSEINAILEVYVSHWCGWKLLKCYTTTKLTGNRTVPPLASWQAAIAFSIAFVSKVTPLPFEKHLLLSRLQCFWRFNKKFCLLWPRSHAHWKHDPGNNSFDDGIQRRRLLVRFYNKGTTTLKGKN